eukprot:TRINITY_DN24979_c0_g1_i2.p1 TRINITY_DN24979_c0_g1~~TRINITY_DN24979_c0_g1_i2.p1  ORF type:complete len:178 (-),score=37.21 TRINITY_DN24979_c0_g1_i2:253-786(-)
MASLAMARISLRGAGTTRGLQQRPMAAFAAMRPCQRSGALAAADALYTIRRGFANVRYAKTHEWLRVDGDTGIVGISDFAQSVLGEVVYCDLPTRGQTFSSKDTFCTIESVKAVGEVYAPCDLEVVEVNERLTETPELVNSGAEEDGWLVKIKIVALPTSAELLDKDGYELLLKESE